MSLSLSFMVPGLYRTQFDPLYFMRLRLPVLAARGLAFKSPQSSRGRRGRPANTRTVVSKTATAVLLVGRLCRPCPHARIA